MLEPRDKLIEDFGLFYEQYGVPRTLGRIYALLLISEEPHLSLDDIAERLGISKANASTSARQLVTLGMIEKTGVPGSRRDHYRVADDSHAEGLRSRLRASLAFTTLIDRAAHLPGLGENATARLGRLERLYSALIATIERFFDEYQDEHDQPAAEAATLTGGKAS